ncbi:hypothetical protein DUI87_34310 [Hirundo rustica rustica]|uniref:Uncharacterized protein n=1 Tax=Hirundo rustica rustica TaxID=333673 RepID=A0A3M0IS53_HIRRU|nr:hypothetical protein DUI87_34310 [Hirundo rustica rustica]
MGLVREADGMGDNKPTIKYSLFSKGEKIRSLIPDPSPNSQSPYPFLAPVLIPSPVPIPEPFPYSRFHSQSLSLLA